MFPNIAKGFLIETYVNTVIGAVQGFASGGGCELDMACHICIAGANTRFGQSEVNLGIIPGYGGTQRLVKLIGKGKAAELILTGDMINAKEAHAPQIGKTSDKEGQSSSLPLLMLVIPTVLWAGYF